MHSLLKNKYVRFASIGVVALLIIVITLLVLNTFSSARSTGLSDTYEMGYAPTVSTGAVGKVANDSRDFAQAESSYYRPEPVPDGYTSDLESYETTEYNISAHTKQFDELCNALATLKADSEIHFKYLNTSINSCQALFYVEENKSDNVLSALTTFQGVEVSRGTESVTRHRQQIQTQTGILEQQLASVERTLATAETQFDEIAEFARANKEASVLSQTIREKLTLIDSLTQRKINLTSQLNQLFQQATDLEEKLDVVQFSVAIYRSYPIHPQKNLQKWEQAWEELKDAYTDTLIGLSAFFGIFLLWTLRLTLYLLVLIVILRGVWKFIQYILKK